MQLDHLLILQKEFQNYLGDNCSLYPITSVPLANLGNWQKIILKLELIFLLIQLKGNM
ncbi:unnamed protein product [Paramecium pentaurelia]|uniref:Uncharacterized protein n=1 Tax=Paramecium pentaurelia TaxID=43138 RepID=A0A8S1VB57_9CILI|nr:unnamed protein product [Paramecium pentaurelia]